jgi:decaprenyl-phosphate phosphoribosyltransferase
VLAAPCAAGVIDRTSVALEVAGAFAVMCAVSSAAYLINDVRDREQDRVHPTKRLRPVAAGEVSPRAAVVLAIALAGIALAGGAAIAPGLALAALLYLLLTLSYSIWWRGVAVLDILVIAAGFVLRPLAGAEASDVYLSHWFVLVTAFGAVFLVTAKRLAELREQRGAEPLRASLRMYSQRRLVVALAVAAAACSAGYVGWALTRPAHVAWYAASVAPFLAWLVRYAMLIGAGAGQAPEELILRDRVLLALSIVWSLLFLGGVYVSH